MSAYDLLFSPFVEFGFLRRALIGCLALSLAAPPLGVFLMLRRMSLSADVLAHGILPGVAAGFWVAGLSVTAMSLGGLIAGLGVALGAGALSRATGGGRMRPWPRSTSSPWRWASPWCPCAAGRWTSPTCSSAACWAWMTTRC
ncbi:metal ABC transporter permease [Roseomonas gilardii]|uniref:metal ABC transporter permease n=1 Tax=Roseomonas gilardii TaxID=257708 RepID=UPI003D103CFA